MHLVQKAKGSYMIFAMKYTLVVNDLFRFSDNHSRKKNVELKIVLIFEPLV